MGRMNARRKKTFPQWLREKRWAILILGAAALLFFVVGLLARTEPADQIQAEDYSEYETGRILEILSDTTEPDPSSDGAARGEQLLLSLPVWKIVLLHIHGSGTIYTLVHSPNLLPDDWHPGDRISFFLYQHHLLKPLTDVQDKLQKSVYYYHTIF